MVSTCICGLVTTDQKINDLIETDEAKRFYILLLVQKYLYISKMENISNNTKFSSSNNRIQSFSAAYAY